VRSELVTYVREAFGWDGDLRGRRRAARRARPDLARPRRPAPVRAEGDLLRAADRARIAAELDLARRATAGRLRVPASHPDRDGRYLVTAPDGTWLRLYEWVDMVPVEPADPAALGALLARLHRCAPATGPSPG
jgi:hypothetical protein